MAVAINAVVMFLSNRFYAIIIFVYACLPTLWYWDAVMMIWLSSEELA